MRVTKKLPFSFPAWWRRSAADTARADNQVKDADSPMKSVPELPGAAGCSDLVGQLGVELWRLERRIQRVPEECAAALAGVRDGVVRLKELLEDHGVEIRPHDGDLYTDGSLVQVVFVQPGGEPSRVVETVEPSVLWQGRMVRHGKVVVGPATSGEQEGGA